MTTGGARSESTIWWCKQQHGIQHLQESSLLEINEKQLVGKFFEDSFKFIISENFADR
jgi:hypothetical protein